MVRGLGSASFLFFRGGQPLSSPEAGVGVMFSGTGDVLADDLCEDEGEGYEFGKMSERSSGGGDGEGERTEGAELNGELAPSEP